MAECIKGKHLNLLVDVRDMVLKEKKKEEKPQKKLPEIIKKEPLRKKPRRAVSKLRPKKASNMTTMYATNVMVMPGKEITDLGTESIKGGEIIKKDERAG